MTALLSWSQTEVALGLTVTGTPQEDDVLASGSLLGQLVKSEAFALAGKDALACSFGESKSADSKVVGDVEQSNIVSDGADDRKDLAFLVTSVLDDAADADGIAVEAGLIEPLVNDRVEATIGPARQERVQLS